MLSRVGALVLIAVVAGPAVSAAVCEIVCATRVDARVSDDAAVPPHSCHDTESTSSPVAVRNQGPVCGHDTASLVSFGATPDRYQYQSDWISLTAPPVSCVTLASLTAGATNIFLERHRSHVPLRI